MARGMASFYLLSYEIASEENSASVSSDRLDLQCSRLNLCFFRLIFGACFGLFLLNQSMVNGFGHRNCFPLSLKTS